MRLSLRRLNRATLARQSLLVREPGNVVDAVRRIVALQAQEPASPYLALWNRVHAFDPAELDAAFLRFEIVKAPLMRVTLHAIAADDRDAFHAAMRQVLRASRLNDRRFLATGLAPRDVDALLPRLVDLADRPRTRPEIEAWLAERFGGPPDPFVWHALRTVAPLVHAPSDVEPWAFGRTPRFVAAPDAHGDEDPSAGRRRLTLRYLRAFGPASRRDLAQFSLLRQSDLRPVLEALGDELVHMEGPDGAPLLDVPGAPLPDEDTPAPPRLLGMWDSVLLAYADRSRVLSSAYRAQVIRRNGDVLPAVLVDGTVAGVWRPVPNGIEITAFHDLPKVAWDGLEEEASALAAFLTERDESAYRRFGHWWKNLPREPARVRTFAPA